MNAPNSETFQFGFFLPLVFGLRSTILVDPQKLYNWLVEWCTPLLFHLLYVSCLFGSSIIAINSTAFYGYSMASSSTYPLSTLGTTIWPMWPAGGKGKFESSLMIRHWGRRIQKKNDIFRRSSFDPQGWGWWSPKGFISKHRLNSFGGLSLVCDWRYACRTLKPNGVLSSPLKFFPARTWRSKMNFRPKILFGIIRSTDLFSGVANLESVRFKSGGGNVFPQPPRSSRFGIPAIHREVGKSLEK